jgi:DNA-directed RNA polymerase subunit H (RpoH/RPB5)
VKDFKHNNILKDTMSDEQFAQYNNLHVFALGWRKYRQVSIPKKNDAFRKEMQFQDYTRLDYMNSSGKPVQIFLLAKSGKYDNSSQDLKRLLAKIREPTDVILVSADPFKIYSRRAIDIFKHLRVKTYLHENFNLIIPNGPLCYPHRIMRHEEVDRLLNEELCCQLVNLPKILVEDVQCIWRGAELGDVIEIKMPSDISGYVIQYRVVVAKSGRVISFRDYGQPVADIPTEPDEDDEIIEQREAADDDAGDDSD